MIDLTTIIVSKNRHTLERAIESARHSTNVDLVMNCLRQDTPLSEKTKSLSRLRNSAAYGATTEYINFLDDDDYFLDDYYEAATELASKDPDVILMSANGLHIPATIDRLKAYLANLEGLPIGSLIIKKSVYLQLNGLNESLTHSENWEFYLRLVAKDISLRVNNEGLWHFTRSPDSLGISQVREYSATAITDWRARWLSQWY